MYLTSIYNFKEIMKVLLITNSIKASQVYICELLQRSWLDIFNKDRRKEIKNFYEESDYFEIIDSKENYESIDIKFVPETVFIVSELLWSNDWVNEGYDIARELILYKFKDKFLQIVFISILEREKLIKLVDIRNKGFVEAFPHVCLLDSTTPIIFEYYSEIHYRLIQHIALSNQGRLDKIGHDLSGLKANITNKDFNKIDNLKNSLLKSLEELGLFQQYSNHNIAGILELMKSVNDKKELANIAGTVNDLIEEIRLKLPDSSYFRPAFSGKSAYRVLIIEDDDDFRNFFYDVFSQFYSTVYPDNKNKVILDNHNVDFSINNAYELISKIGKNVDIFLLDLLYKDKNGNWLNFNGLDLYRLIDKVNPYAVIRIITSLPRSIVAKLVETILESAEKPNTDQVFTKKYGFDALRDSIYENIPKINEECKRQERSKNVWAPFPKEGVFGWSGIKNYLSDLLYKYTEDYEKIKNEALILFSQFKNNELTKTSPGWNKGILPKPAQKDGGDNVGYVKDKLLNIITHRMMVIHEALNKDEHKIFYLEYNSKITKVADRTASKGYFQTALGFNGKEYTKEADKSGHFFQISFTNLFPHELDYIITFKREKEEEVEKKLLKEEYPVLNDLFMEILTDLSLYESWADLNLDFNPYSENLVFKIENEEGYSITVLDFTIKLTLKNARDFFQSLITYCFQDYINEIIDKIMDLILNEYSRFEDTLEDKLTIRLINNLINKHLEID